MEHSYSDIYLHLPDAEWSCKTWIWLSCKTHAEKKWATHRLSVPLYHTYFINTWISVLISDLKVNSDQAKDKQTNKPHKPVMPGNQLNWGNINEIKYIHIFNYGVL